LRLKNSLQNFARVCWRILTEVPGWPDAPRNLRIRRLFPIVMPVAALMLYFLWNLVWVHPRIQRVRTAHQPILALDQEVADLQLSGSDLHASKTATRAAEVGRTLLTEPSQLVPALEKLKATAHEHGWEATFHSIPGSTPPLPPEAQVSFVMARGKLVAAAGNTHPFPSLLTCLEQFSMSDPWIDLMRLALRADEQGQPTVEVYLRAGCRASHEKTP